MAKYKIVTNPVALSRAWTALNIVDGLSLPQINVSEENINELAYMLILNLASIEQAYNMFLNAITGNSGIDFTKESQEEVVDLVVNFCKTIDSTFLSLIKKYLAELKLQRDMAIQKRQEMIDSEVMKAINNPKLLKQYTQL